MIEFLLNNERVPFEKIHQEPPGLDIRCKNHELLFRSSASLYSTHSLKTTCKKMRIKEDEEIDDELIEHIKKVKKTSIDEYISLDKLEEKYGV